MKIEAENSYVPIYIVSPFHVMKGKPLRSGVRYAVVYLFIHTKRIWLLSYDSLCSCSGGIKSNGSIGKILAYIAYRVIPFYQNYFWIMYKITTKNRNVLIFYKKFGCSSLRKQFTEIFIDCGPVSDQIIESYYVRGRYCGRIFLEEDFYGRKFSKLRSLTEV